MKPHTDTPIAVPHAGVFEALGMTTLCLGSAIVNSVMSALAWRAGAGAGAGGGGAVVAAGFTDRVLDALVVWEVIVGLTALAVLRARGYPLQALLPRPSWRGVLAGAGLYLCAVAANSLMVPLLPHAASPISGMVGAARVSMVSVLPMAVVNGAYEEIFLLGYLMRGLRRLGASTAIGVTLLVRLLCHAYQGPVGALSVMLFGAVLALYYQRSGRLFPVVLAHTVCDIVPFL